MGEGETWSNVKAGGSQFVEICRGQGGDMTLVSVC